ncbi:hypothetical protein EMCG_03243 [[Emmonsia] crescens]|uniref:Survival Motor Neuron Gemin2-binding domain-containing protein n=1 Tax=[Emmonsia] crescens TaxID=73230 RepID=A0A0G2HVU0_9EURO|nr:hypothetical protein EMCG_03243 [Emmonsia crescens UAMH 3008]
MGKRKRSKKKPLSQEEIWDDSALIQSWDDAVEEYNLYHSIQARGENVDDVLRAEDARARAEDEDEAEAEAAVSDSYDEHAAGAQPHAGLESVYEEEADGDEMETARTALHGEHGDQQETPSAKVKVNPEANHTASGGFANMPQLVSQGGDDASGADGGLKNLMMAWYFAGYYTGLYEGQQRGANQRS